MSKIENQSSDWLDWLDDSPNLSDEEKEEVSKILKEVDESPPIHIGQNKINYKAKYYNLLEGKGNEQWLKVHQAKNDLNQNIIIWDTGEAFYTEYFENGKRVRFVRTGQEDDITYLKKFLTKTFKPE